MMKKSLFHKTIGLTVAVFLLVGVLVSLAAGYTLYSRLMKEYESKGIAIAESIASSSAFTLLNTDSASVQGTISQFKQISGVAYVAVRDADHQILVHTFVPEIPPEFDRIHHAIVSIPFSHKIIVQSVKLSYVGPVLDITAPILGGQLGFIHVGMDVSQIHLAILKTIAQILGVIVVVLIGCLGLMRVFMKKITDPLLQLTRYADALRDHEFIAPDVLKAQLDGILESSKDEIGTLAGAFQSLDTSLQTYITSLRETTAVKERIESELAVARHIQLNMLPKPLDASVKKNHFDVCAYMNSAKEVGGDFYDFFVNDEQGLVFVAVGDVSGKGVPASLTMSICMSLIRAAAVQSTSPSAILTAVNKQLCDNNETSQFVTVFLGVLHVKTGHLDYCLAGHMPPLIKSQTGTIRELPLTNGMALGLDDTFFYQSERVQLEAEDQMVAFTDGVSEAENEAFDQYGVDALRNFLAKQTMEPKSLCEAIVADITSFAGSTPQSDDLTLLVLKWQPKDTSIMIEKTLKVHFINDISELQKLQSVVEMFGETHGLSTKMVLNTNLVLEELLTNVIFYGYNDHVQHLIYVTFQLENNKLMLTIEDDGIPFNPLESPEVDTSQVLDERNIGGLGIHFVKSLASDFEYKRTDTANILSFTLSD
jgi:sigma-B regulation protein RsbU (phosphoserine phosphatase)